MNLPNVAGTLSDSDKIGWDDRDQTVAKLLYQIVNTDDFANLNNWTVTDSTGTNITLAGGIVSMNGSNAGGANGIHWTGGDTRAEGYFEIKVRFNNSVSVYSICNLNTANALSGSVYTGFSSNASRMRPNATSTTFGYAHIVTATWYTMRIYVLPGPATDWAHYRSTIQGGIYDEEYVLGETVTLITAYTNPLYFGFQRFTNNAGALTDIKEYRYCSGYDTGGEYTEYVHDAGAGQTFLDFDLSNFAMPNSMDTTNLLFAYSYDDGTPSYSSYLTLANLKAEGAQGTDKRYIRIRVQLNSDGSTQTYAAKPDATDAITGIGAAPDYPVESNVKNGIDYDNGNLTGTYSPDFPAVGNTRDTDTVNGEAGTLDSDKILKSNATGSGAGNWNDDNMEAGEEANVKKDIAFGLSQTGTYEGSIAAPAAPVLTFSHYNDTCAFLQWTFSSNAKEYQLWYKESGGVYARYPDASTTFKSLAETVEGLTASTTYVFKVTASNATGATDSNELTLATTAATPLVTRQEAALKSLIGAMRIVDGYNYDWTATVNDPDKAVNRTHPNADVRQLEEVNLDESELNHNQAYSNRVQLEISAYGKMTAVDKAPEFKINEENNKMVDDFKRLLGLNPHLNDTCLFAQYIGNKRILSRAGDVFRPGYIKIIVDVRYAQDRRTPTAYVN